MRASHSSGAEGEMSLFAGEVLCNICIDGSQSDKACHCERAHGKVLVASIRKSMGCFYVRSGV